MSTPVDNPLVTVVTPVYNAAASLAETIQSVVQQSYPHWEMLLVDDCSTDDSVSIIERYSREDPRVRLIRLERNSGAAVARNTAIEAAKGRYIAFLDSDDLWLPEKLERQLGFMQETGHAFSYTGYQKIDAAGEPTGQCVTSPARLSYRQLLKSNRIGCLTAMYDTAQLGKVSMPLIRARQDYALWLKLLKRVEYGYGLDECLALYRVGPASVSSNKLKMVKYNWKLFREVERFSPLKALYYLGWNIFRKLAG